MSKLYDDKPAAAWWEEPTAIPHLGGNSDNYLTACGQSLGEASVLRKEVLTTSSGDPWVGKGCTKAILKMLEKLKARKVFIGRGTHDYADVWIWNSGVLKVSFGDTDEDGDESIEYTIMSTRGETDEFLKIIKDHPQAPRPPRKPDGQAYVLCELPMRGIEIVPIGLAGQELLRENYSAEVLAGFDRAVRDLTSAKPGGRLTILDGPPGTGKTYMVRAFMSAVPESKFVVIPPDMVKTLANPQLILTFIREVHTGDGPLVLILEDADQCLSKRKAENMASISAILNLSDGIIGSLLDLRVLATTNTSAQEFDEALLRKGRMSAHIRMGGLPEEDVKKIWTRLASERNPLPKVLWGAGVNNGQKITVLADIYTAYNDLSEVDKALGDIKKLQS